MFTHLLCRKQARLPLQSNWLAQRQTRDLPCSIHLNKRFGLRLKSSTSVKDPISLPVVVVPAVSSPSPLLLDRTKQKEDQEFVLSVISSSTTKRDAKGFLSRFEPYEKTKTNHQSVLQIDKNTTTNVVASTANNTSLASTVKVTDMSGFDFDIDLTKPQKRVQLEKAQLTRQLSKSGVNLGTLFVPSVAMSRTPQFLHKVETQPESEVVIRTETVLLPIQLPIHVAVVKIQVPHLLNDDVLDGVCLTLCQLARLGMQPIIVLDTDPIIELGLPFSQPARRLQGNSVGFREWRQYLSGQAQRLHFAVQRRGGHSLILDECFGISEEDDGTVDVRHSALLQRCLQEGRIPILVPLGWTYETYKGASVEANAATLALINDLIPPSENDPSVASPKWSVDRLIVLDPTGGIPTSPKLDGSHVFINLEQEYSNIMDNLSKMDVGEILRERSVGGLDDGYLWSPRQGPFDVLKSGLPPGIPPFLAQLPQKYNIPAQAAKNLDLAQKALSVLPASSSAIIITPQEVALAAKNVSTGFSVGVQTRRHKNPLIHNLLTDKSGISPSLPIGRARSKIALPPSYEPVTDTWQPATFIKKGMPLRIVPDPLVAPWVLPGADGTTLDLRTDPRIDLPSLIHLINDSFNREIDIERYLDRIQNKIAGVIIAGDYEGGAILTWETPDDPGYMYASPDASLKQTSDIFDRCLLGAGNASESGRGRLDPLGNRIPPVPYLDKFAVLKRCQGTGGVADIVFNAMVRTCFPHGVLWRSRKNNPVNKWYFERAAGTWKLPNEMWTAFWTGGMEEGGTGTAGASPISASQLDGKLDSDSYWKARSRAERFRDYVRVCEGIQPTWKDSKRPD